MKPPSKEERIEQLYQYLVRMGNYGATTNQMANHLRVGLATASLYARVLRSQGRARTNGTRRAGALYSMTPVWVTVKQAEAA